MDYKFFRQIQPERGIHGNFASGQINYKWKTANNTAWVPSQSYLKLKVKLTSDGGNGRLDMEGDIALNMMVVDQIFQQMNLRVNGVLVSEWNDYVAQCAALKCRLSCDMDSRQSLLSCVNYTKVDMIDRMSQIASDGRLEKDTVWNKSIRLLPDANNGTDLTFMDRASHEVEFIAADRSIIFTKNDSLESIPDMSKYFAIGDYVYFNDGADKSGTVLDYDSTYSQNDTLIVDVAVTDLGPVALNDVVRIHDLYYINRRYSNSVQNNTFDLIWKPPLGFFDISTEVSGEYNLELTPNPEGVWQKYAIESLRKAYTPAHGDVIGDYSLEITEANFYLWTHVHPAPINDTQTFVYSDIICSSQNLTTKSLTSKVFNIHPNNHSLTLAWQDSAAGDDTRYSRAKFKIARDQELQIKRFYISMDGITLPDPLPSPDVRPIEGVNQLYQRYVENFHYSGATKSKMTKYETMEEWKRAGIYFHYKWGIGYKKSGQAMVYSNFEQSTQPDWLGETNAILRNPQVLLFDHYYCSVSMSVKDGELLNVEKV